MSTRPYFRSALLEQLRCPYCDSTIEPDVEVEGNDAGIRHGVVQCRCYRYPIIEGILVLRQEGPHREGMFARATDALDRGDSHAALTEVLPLPRASTTFQKALGILARLRFSPVVASQRARTARTIHTLTGGEPTFADAAHLLQIPSYADYLVYRYANPSFLAAIPLLLLFGLLHDRSARGLTVLDLGCGAGHSSYLIARLFPSLRPICIDHDFSNLFLAKRYFAPKATCLCLDLQLPLPFDDHFAAGVLCLDVFHYVNAKTSLLREVDRVCADDALWIFPHLHNRLHEVPAPGVPLAPVDYARLFSIKEGTLLPERRVLEDFTRDTFRLVPHRDAASLDSVPNLSFVGGEPSELWGQHDGLVERLLTAADDLAVNPIFHTEASGEIVKLTARWPNPHLERECAEVKDFLPSQFDVPASLLHGIAQQDLTSDELETVRSLLRRFMVVPIPPRYGAGSS